jgi:hypothetical protein
MSDPAIPHIRLLAEGLGPLVAPAGNYAVFASLSYDWRDKLLSWFRTPDPVVEVERYLEHSELKIHLGGVASPVRSAEPTMTLAAFVAALQQVPREHASDPILLAMSVTLPEEPDYTLTLNVPTRSVTCKVQPRKKRVLLSFRAAGRGRV